MGFDAIMCLEEEVILIRELSHRPMKNSFGWGDPTVNVS